MRSHPHSFILPVVLVAFIASAHGQSKTDAEMDWLKGPVKSVSSAIYTI